MFHAFAAGLAACLLCAVPMARAAADTLGLAPVALAAGTGSRAPDVASSPGRDEAVVTWVEPAEDGHALRFARFDGRRFGPPGEIARGGEWFVNWADTPRVFVETPGRWTAHWLERAGRPAYAYHVHYSRTVDAGRTWSGARRLHADDSATEHGFVSWFAGGGGDGGVAAAWLDGRRTASDGPMTLRTAALGASGPRSERALDARVCDCCQTAAAVTDAGPVVVYRDRSADEIRDIAIVRRTAAGWSEPRLVHPDGWRIAGCPVNGPDVAATGNTVLVAWFTLAGGTARVRIAVSNDAGASFQAPIELSGRRALGRVQVVERRGRFAVAWMDETDDGAVLRLAEIEADGPRVVGRHDLVSLAGGRVAGFPRIASLGDRLLVVWTGSTGGNEDHAATTRIRAGLWDPGAGPG
jgi:hypothetical protein